MYFVFRRSMLYSVNLSFYRAFSLSTAWLAAVKGRIIMPVGFCAKISFRQSLNQSNSLWTVFAHSNLSISFFAFILYIFLASVMTPSFMNYELVDYVICFVFYSHAIFFFFLIRPHAFFSVFFRCLESQLYHNV